VANLPSASVDPFAPPTANLEPRPGANAEEQVLATRGSRLAAYFLDLLLLVPLAGVGAGIGVAVSGMLKFDVDAEKGLIAIFAVLLILPLQIYQWYLVSTSGQTLAKRWMRIKIVKVDGGPVDFTRAVLLRSWVSFGIVSLLALLGLQAIGRLFNLADTVSIFTSNQRMIHDLIAGTKVIQAAPVRA
jgi:uncharacterized RDD family membrane protein YckC